METSEAMETGLRETRGEQELWWQTLMVYLELRMENSQDMSGATSWHNRCHTHSEDLYTRPMYLAGSERIINIVHNKIEQTKHNNISIRQEQEDKTLRAQHPRLQANRVKGVKYFPNRYVKAHLGSCICVCLSKMWPTWLLPFDILLSSLYGSVLQLKPEASCDCGAFGFKAGSYRQTRYVTIICLSSL